MRLEFDPVLINNIYPPPLLSSPDLTVKFSVPSWARLVVISTYGVETLTAARHTTWLWGAVRGQ